MWRGHADCDEARSVVDKFFEMAVPAHDPTTTAGVFEQVCSGSYVARLAAQACYLQGHKFERLVRRLERAQLCSRVAKNACGTQAVASLAST